MNQKSGVIPLRYLIFAARLVHVLGLGSSYTPEVGLAYMIVESSVLVPAVPRVRLKNDGPAKFPMMPTDSAPSDAAPMAATTGMFAAKPVRSIAPLMVIDGGAMSVAAVIATSVRVAPT